MSLLSIYSGSACAWIISEINRDTMGELQVVIPKAASTLLYPMVRPLTVRLGSLLLRIYSAFSFVLFSALYFLKTANIQELNVLLFAEYGEPMESNPIVMGIYGVTTITGVASEMKRALIAKGIL